MDDPMRVRAHERVEDLGHQLPGLHRDEGPLPPDVLLERLAGHILIGGEELGILRAALVEQLDDVGVPQRGAQVRLALEALVISGAGLAFRRLPALEFQRHELSRAVLAREVHGAEAPLAELLHDLVAQNSG